MDRYILWSWKKEEKTKEEEQQQKDNTLLQETEYPQSTQKTCVDKIKETKNRFDALSYDQKTKF